MNIETQIMRAFSVFCEDRIDTDNIDLSKLQTLSFYEFLLIEKELESFVVLDSGNMVLFRRGDEEYDDPVPIGVVEDVEHKYHIYNFICGLDEQNMHKRCYLIICIEVIYQEMFNWSRSILKEQWKKLGFSQIMTIINKYSEGFK